MHVWDIPIPNTPIVIFGRFYYHDIFKEKHSFGFILRLTPEGESIPIRAPDAYTYWD